MCYSCDADFLHKLTTHDLCNQAVSSPCDMKRNGQTWKARKTGSSKLQQTYKWNLFFGHWVTIRAHDLPQALVLLALVLLLALEDDGTAALIKGDAATIRADITADHYDKLSRPKPAELTTENLRAKRAAHSLPECVA